MFNQALVQLLFQPLLFGQPVLFFVVLLPSFVLGIKIGKVLGHGALGIAIALYLL